MLEEIAGEVKKNPAWLFAAVAVVALLAYLSSRNSVPQQATFAGGGAAAPVDPQAAAIEEAAIGAGQANVNTLASLIGQENSNQSALAGSLAQTSAARDTSLAQTEEQRVTSLAQTAATQAIDLAQIDAALQASTAQTAAGVTIAQGNNSATVQAASINSQSAQQIAQINAGTEAARIAAEQQVAQSQQQTSKDIARAQDNTNIFGDIVGVGKTLLSFFGI